MSSDNAAPPTTNDQGPITTVDRVVRYVREGIRAGRYAPGQRLPEVDLTRDLQVSRGPLREALARLAAEGAILIEPYRGATVKCLTEVDLRELSQIRERLEGMAASLAARHVAEHGSEQPLAQQLRSLTSNEHAADVASYMTENVAFHDIIVQMCAHELLDKLMQQLHTNAFRVQLTNRIPASGRERSIEEHAEIAKAILDGAPEEAEAAMRRHIRNSHRLALEAAAALLPGGVST